MALPAVLMGVGAGLKAWSGIMAGMQKAKQGFANAEWLNEQANFAQESMFRELRRTEQLYTNRVGQQIGDYAASGADLSGSAINTVGGTMASAMQELKAVRRKGEMEVKLARARARLEEQNANAAGNPLTLLMGAGASLIGSYANTKGFGEGFGGDYSAATSSVASSPLSTVPFSQGSYGGYQSKYLGNIV